MSSCFAGDGESERGEGDPILRYRSDRYYYSCWKGGAKSRYRSADLPSFANGVEVDPRIGLPRLRGGEPVGALATAAAELAIHHDSHRIRGPLLIVMVVVVAIGGITQLVSALL